MSQTIYKMAGTRDPFARIPHTLLEDERLSWQAKGILCYLVGKPDGWKVRVGDLVKRGRDGEHAIRSGLKELRAAGYAELVRVRDEKGKMKEWAWRISDQPVFHPDGGFPHVDNHHLSKKEDSKKESKETEETAEVSAAVNFGAIWRPDERTKAEKLRSIRPRRDYPSEREFEAFLEKELLDHAVTYRPGLYDELCTHKWHKWNEKLQKWCRIVDWRKYVECLDNKIGTAFN